MTIDKIRRNFEELSDIAQGGVEACNSDDASECAYEAQHILNRIQDLIDQLEDEEENA